MKKFITIPTLFFATSGLFGATLTSAGNGTSTNDREYAASEKITIASDGVIMKHDRTVDENGNPAGARHFNNFVIDVATYSNTQFIIAETTTTGVTSNCVAFNGATFKSTATDGIRRDITVSATEDASKIALACGGITVDNVSLTVNLSGQSYIYRYQSGSTGPKIVVKNNGVMTWKGCNTVDSGKFNLNVEAGSVFNATFDKSDAETHLSNSDIAGKVYFSTTKATKFYDSNTVSNQKANNASYMGNRWDLAGEDTTLTISNSEANSIIFTYSKFILRESTLTLNSTNAIGYKSDGVISGQENVTLEIGQYENAASSSKLVLGANNDFKSVIISSNVNSTLTITLDGNQLSFQEINSAELKGTIFVKDFAESLLKIDSVDSKLYDAQTGLLTNIKWGEDKDTAKDLYWNKDTGFVSAIAIPEPSTYAAIFGALALGFVAYRRRK